MRKVFICQLSETEQAEMRQKLAKYLKIEGFKDEDFKTQLEDAMNSKIDDIDWKAINLIIAPEPETKAFHWSDLTGSGRNWLISEEDLLPKVTQSQHLFGEQMGVMPPFYNNPISLKSFVESAVQGQEWYDQCDSYTCIGTIEQVKNQLHI